MYDLKINFKERGGFEIYRGDYEAFTLVFKDNQIAEQGVDKVYFSCKGLGVCGVEMEKNTDAITGAVSWTHEFLAEDTKNYKAGKYTYAIEVVFNGNKPLSRDGLILEIKERENPRGCN